MSKAQSRLLLTLTIVVLSLYIFQPVTAGPPTPLRVGDEFIYQIETFDFEVIVNGIDFADKGRFSMIEQVSVVVDGFGLDRRGPKARINETVGGQTHVFVTYFDGWLDLYREGIVYAKSAFAGYPNILLFIEPTVGLSPRADFALLPYLVTNDTKSYQEAIPALEALAETKDSGFPNNMAISQADIDPSTSMFEFFFHWQSFDSRLNDEGAEVSFEMDFSINIVIDIRRSVVSSLQYSFYSITTREDNLKSRKVLLELHEIRPLVDLVQNFHYFLGLGIIFIIGVILFVRKKRGLHGSLDLL